MNVVFSEEWVGKEVKEIMVQKNKQQTAFFKLL